MGINICICRGTCEYEFDNGAYEKRPQAWILGDVEAYRYIVGVLTGKRKAGEGGVIEINNFAKINSMALTICRPARSKTAPRVRTFERIVNQDGVGAFELVVCGNVGGYKKLAREFQDFCKNPKGDLDNYRDMLEFMDTYWAAGSMAVNIREPVPSWGRRKLGHFASVIYRKRDMDEVRWLVPEAHCRPPVDGKWAFARPHMGARYSTLR